MHQLLPTATEVDLFTAYAQPEPGVRVNFVTSTDGAATLDGRSAGLSGPADRAVFHVLRAIADVVMVGAGTARVEGYGPVRPAPEHLAWRRAQGLAPVPPVAIVSGSLALDPASAMFTAAVARPIILTGPAPPADRLAVLEPLADVVRGHSAGDWLRALIARGLSRVLCEGGPRLFSSLLAGDHVDELCLTVAPLLAGPAELRMSAPEARAPTRGLDLVHVLADEGFLFLRYRRRPQAPASASP